MRRFSSGGLDLGDPLEISRAMAKVKQQIERENSCPHETACWLPPDFWPDRYQCNQCGKRVSDLQELREE